MKRLFLLFGLYLVIGLAAPAAAQSATNPLDFVRDINRVRSEHRLGFFKYSYTLSRAALRHGQDMFARQYFAHRSPSGQSYYTWVQQGPARFGSLGENLAKGQPTTVAVVTAWMGSGGHRANLLNTKYSHVGTAMVKGRWRGRPTTIYVAIFGRAATP